MSELQDIFVSKANKHLRATCFSGQKIQKKIDLSAPRLNLEAAKCMTEIQTEKDPMNKDRYSHKCAIVSSATIQCAGKKVNQRAQRSDQIPYRFVKGKTSDAFYFNAIKMLKFLFKAHGLDELAKTCRIEVALTFDAAQLTKYLCQVMAGIKLVDPRTRCPITGVLLLLPTDPNAKFQSVFNCWPFRICIGKETDALLEEHFKQLFQLFHNLSQPNQQIIPEWMPLILSTPIDMSAKWKGLCKGGGRGIHTYFCCHCATTSNDCATPNENLCDRCAARHSVPSDTHSTSDDSDSSDSGYW